MGLMTPGQYLAGLNHGRIVYYKGEKVDNVAEHPALGACARTMALDFEIAEDPKYQDLAVVHDMEGRKAIAQCKALVEELAQVK